MSQHYWTQLVACIWLPCWYLLIATYWMSYIKLVRMPGCNAVARTWLNKYDIMKHPRTKCCMKNLTISNITQHVAKRRNRGGGGANALNLLRPNNVVLKCCDRLAGLYVRKFSLYHMGRRFLTFPCCKING